MASKESVWEKLNSLPVPKKKKGEFDYASWTDMWQAVNDNYPDVQFEFLTFDNPVHGFMDCMVYPDGTASVHSKVTIDGITHPMWLPITEHNSKTPKQKWTSVDVANTKMRCLTKNISMFGLGSHIYRNEDLEDREVTKTEAKPKPKPKAKKEEVIDVEDVPQEEPILYEGKPFNPEVFIKSFKDTLSAFPVKTQESLLEYFSKYKEQFTLVKEHNLELHEETMKFLGAEKNKLPKEEEGDKDES